MATEPIASRRLAIAALPQGYREGASAVIGLGGKVVHPIAFNRSMSRCVLFQGASIKTLAFSTLISIAAPALAQDAEPASTELETAEIVVTGSRIARPDFTSPTPVTTVGGEEMGVRGSTNFSELLNEMPAFSPKGAASTSAAASGVASVDLRGLGPNRTLVLFNGRRHVPSTPEGVVDLNAVPSIAVGRMEVVTGGASAAWGSDAIAGVVNVIYDTDDEGLRFEVQTGISDKGDAAETRVGLSFATKFADERGHIMVAGEYNRINDLLTQADRDWGRRGYGIIPNPADRGTSDGVPRLILRPNIRISVANPGGVITSPSSVAFLQFGPGGAVLPFDRGASAGPLYQIGGDGSNLNQYASLQLPYERKSLLTAAHYDLTDDIRLFFEGSYSNAEASNPILPSFDFGSLTIQSDNALIPADLRALLQQNNVTSFRLGRVHNDLGFYTAQNSRDTYRAVLGLSGSVFDDWKWEAYYQYGRTDTNTRQLNNRLNMNFAMALDAVLDPRTGRPVCRAALNAANLPPPLQAAATACVPINLFGDGSPSQAAIDYVTETSFINRSQVQQVAAAQISGDLIDLWAGPLAVATGAEYRKESIDTTTDPISKSFGFIFNNAQPLAGGFNVFEVFGEAALPLLEGLPFAHSLEVNGAVRYTDYSSIGRVVTWKGGATWSPFDGILVRGAISRDIRAPNIDELFRAGTTSFASPRDPCAAASQADNSVIAANCLAAGLPANFAPGAIVLGSVASGNTGLQEERSTTKTLGAAFEPAFAPGLRASIDWYDINLKGVIATLPVQTVLDLCYGADDYPNASCGLITRDAAGNLTSVSRKFLNVGSARVRGVDFQVDYSFEMAELFAESDARLRTRLLGTYLYDKLESVTGLQVFEQAGEVNPSTNAISTGLPHWRWNASLDYEDGPFGIHPRLRYIGKAKFENSYGPEDIDDNDVGSQIYVDLTVNYRFEATGSDIELYAGVNNLFDNDPPVVPSDFVVTQATNVNLYDTIGRYFFVGARAKF
jgi:iron complex outermembrane receptor protein